MARRVQPSRWSRTHSVAASASAALTAVKACTGKVLAGRRVTGPDLVTPLKSRTPIYLAHRGAHLLYPENSIEGLRATGRAGFAGECDVRALRDGSLALCHIATTGDTMTGPTVDVSALDRLEWRQRRVRPQIPNGQGAVPALWDDVVTELGGRMLLVPELKDGLTSTREQLIDSILSRSLARSVIVQSFDYADVRATTRAGIASLYLSDAADPATLIADGIEFVGCSTAASGRYIHELTTAGVVPIVYTVNTRAQWATSVLEHGAAGVFTDDPWHVSRQFAARSSDPFQLRDAWPHFVGGCVGTVWTGDELASIWEYAPPRALRRVNLDPPYDSPISLDAGWTGQDRGPRVRARMTVTFLEQATSASSWVGMFVGRLRDEDEVYRDGAVAGQDGYHASLERSGRLSISRVGNGAAPVVLAASPVPAAPVAPASARSQPTRIELVIDATGVRLTNLTSSLSVAVRDTVYRGPCRLNLTNHGTEAEYEDVGIEDLA